VSCCARRATWHVDVARRGRGLVACREEQLGAPPTWDRTQDGASMLRSLRSNGNASKAPMVTRSSIQGAGSISSELGEQAAPGEARTGRQIGGRNVYCDADAGPAGAPSAGEGRRPVLLCMATNREVPSGRRATCRDTHRLAGRSVSRSYPPLPVVACARAGRRRDRRGRRGQTEPVSQQRAESVRAFPRRGRRSSPFVPSRSRSRARPPETVRAEVGCALLLRVLGGGARRQPLECARARRPAVGGALLGRAPLSRAHACGLRSPAPLRRWPLLSRSRSDGTPRAAAAHRACEPARCRLDLDTTVYSHYGVLH